jgi:hypothetical protein
MLCGCLSVLSVLTVRTRFDDPDMWWHLKMGQIIWTTHTIPTTDLFSYTTNHHAWVPHEWLSQVSIYCAYKWDGYSGLMLWLCVLTALLLITSYILCALYSGNAKTALAAALAVWFFSTAGTAIRPQMIGYLLLVVELLLVHLGSTRSPRWFLWLPPLFAIWVNCHGSFFLGMLVMALFLFCSFFDFRMGSIVSTRWEARRRRMLLLALLFSAAALFLNPMGADQVLYPLRTMIHLPLNLTQVEEWKPLLLTAPRGIGMVAVLGCICLFAIVRRSDLLWHEVLLLALGTELAISHRRMLFVFGILAAPVFSRLISDAWDSYNAEQDRPAVNTIFIAVSLLTTFLAFPQNTYLTRQVNEGNPVNAVAYIKAHHLAGNMLNSYRYGGYLIWALPERPVFIDGRGDVFEWVGVLDDFARWSTLQSDPRVLLDKYRIEFCLLERHSPMTQVLELLPGWNLAYSDEKSAIFVRNSTAQK